MSHHATLKQPLLSQQASVQLSGLPLLRLGLLLLLTLAGWLPDVQHRLTL